MFHEFAKRKRQAAGLSQDTLARAFGYTHRANVSKMEAGKLDWRFKHVIILAGLLGMTAAELVAEFEANND